MFHVLNNNHSIFFMFLKSAKKCVDGNAVHFLLDKWKNHEQDFKLGRLRHEVIWRTISEELQEEGYDFNGNQCENKFKDFRKTYMKIKDHNSQTGAEPKFWKFFDRMEEFFSDKPNVEPISLASNRRKRVLDNNSNSEKDSSDETNEAEEK